MTRDSRLRSVRLVLLFFFFSSRRRHTRSLCDWSSDVCSSDLRFDLRKVARILAIDGDQRHFPEIEPVAQRCRLGAPGLLGGGLRELDRDVVGGDRDQADGARVAHRADTLEHLGAARQLAAAFLDPDDVARQRAVAVGCPDVENLAQLAVGRRHDADTRPAGRLLVEAEDVLGAAAQAADDAGFVGVLAAALQRGEHAVADRRGRAAARAMRVDLDARRGAVFFFVVAARHGQQVAVFVDAHDLQYGDVSQCFGVLECLGAVGGDVARVAQVAQELLELDALIALQSEGTRNLALAYGSGALLDECQNFVAGRDATLSHRFRYAMAFPVPWPSSWGRPSSWRWPSWRASRRDRWRARERPS